MGLLSLIGQCIKLDRVADSNVLSPLKKTAKYREIFCVCYKYMEV